MSSVGPQRANTDPAPSGPDNSFAEGVVSAFMAMVDGLSPDLQERVRIELSKKFPSVSTPKPGQVLGTILKLVPRGREFTIDEVKKSVEAEGVQATAKAIYNALGYLTRKHKIVRVGHGRYVIDGALFETTEDLGGGPPSRHEIDDT
ncbi:MAG: hypothetical protein JSR61_06205 [Proteobacteria bacterium]|nr:hypothetical protein [Pseudomonadota bacterium]